MPNMQSINQNKPHDALPSFRSLSVALRCLLLINGAVLMVAFVQASSWQDIVQRMVNFSALLQPTLLLSLLLLYIFNPALARIPYRQGVAAVMLLVAAITLVIYRASNALYLNVGEQGLIQEVRGAIVGGVIAGLLLVYFRLRAQALSPALHEARLQALQARIRPHFLFNTINAVLGIVRAHPKRAETALEDMADLFRMAMSQSSELVAVGKEIELSRQYLALEQLRLGDRLKVDWQVLAIPEDALMPPLILQPLLENAVYHGIEPLSNGGVINIKLYRNGNEIHLEVSNPRQDNVNRHIGNEIALINIRERLALQFDVEARFFIETGKDFYHVHIILPYTKGRAE